MDPATDAGPVPPPADLDLSSGSGPTPSVVHPTEAAPGVRAGPHPGPRVDGASGADTGGKADAQRTRRSSRAKVLVTGVALLVVAVLLLTVQPWSRAQANPDNAAASTPTTQKPHAPARTSPAAPVVASGSSSLAYTATPGTPQPPPTADPQAPGVLVDSGENRSDAFLYQTGGRYYLYTSSTTSIPFLNVPVSSTTDFKTWTPPKDAMVHLPAWAAEPFTWGPDVHRFGSQYVLYFTGFLKALDEQCIGAAFSSAPDGPFTAQAHPFICQSGLSGSIDPRIFTDSDGTLYMQWKSDQNAHGSSTPTTLWSQRLGSDGLTLLGSPSALMQPDEPWQGTVIEAPDMVEVNGVYWLAYAANWFNQPAYGIGVAWCKGPLGPCADLSNQPLISSNAQGKGPGEPSFYQDQSGVWMLYTPVESLPGDPPRPVYITRVGFTDKGAYLAAGGPPPALMPAPTSSAKHSAP